MMKRAILIISSVALGGLLAYQVITYAVNAHRTMPLTMVAYLPKSDFCSAVCIGDQMRLTLSDDQLKVLEHLLTHRFQRVYRGDDAVPETNKVREVNSEHYRYRDLCLLGFVVKDSGPFWFKAGFSHYQGPLSASGYEATYLWILGSWHRVGAVGGWNF